MTLPSIGFNQQAQTGPGVVRPLLCALVRLLGPLGAIYGVFAALFWLQSLYLGLERVLAGDPLPPLLLQVPAMLTCVALTLTWMAGATESLADRLSSPPWLRDAPLGGDRNRAVSDPSERLDS